MSAVVKSDFLVCCGCLVLSPFLDILANFSPQPYSRGLQPVKQCALDHSNVAQTSLLTAIAAQLTVSGGVSAYESST
jgi:hypothetical protein